MESLRVESASAVGETNPFLMSWLRGGKGISILFKKNPGERTRIYFGAFNRELLIKLGWKFTEQKVLERKGRKIFIRGDSRLINFGNGNQADRIIELLNEEESGFLSVKITPHYYRGIRSQNTRSSEHNVERKATERNGWKLVISYRNESLGDYLCHLFSSPGVQARKGNFGFGSPVIAWWEVHQFFPTSTRSLDKGDIRIGSTLRRGDVYIDSTSNPHTLIIGSSGAGKSSMIVGMMNDILESRAGKVILIDPHGDTARNMEGTRYKKYVISPCSENSVNVIGIGRNGGTAYKVAEDFLSILRSYREVQYSDPMVGPRIEDLISRGISILAGIEGMTLVDLYNILRNPKVGEEIAIRSKNRDLKHFLEELESMTREEKASTERAIGRIANDPMIRSLICNPEDDGQLVRAMEEEEIVIFDLDRSSLGYEDSRLLSNIFALYVWFAISEARRGNYFLFLEEGQDYQSTLIADMISSGRKFGLRIFFVTTSFKSISKNLDSMLVSNISNYIFMKLTDPDKLVVQELMGQMEDLPNDPFDFLLTNTSGRERGRIEPVRFRNEPQEFKVRNHLYLTEKEDGTLSSRIDEIISGMKGYDSIYFIMEEFSQVLGEYDRREVISRLKDKIGGDQSIHFAGRITINSGRFKGRHECFQVVGRKEPNPTLPEEFKITSDLISNILEKK
ncbi:MAG: DUF87 domain-containing protein [Candidatus Thermoplasmatota archaeon]|nr:DUF87 domain-containing protein [Candidatus Thermoplasmatota archaeon]